jgi:hypothetical protein
MKPEDQLAIEHVRCHQWLSRYRDRFVTRVPSLTCEQIEELVTVDEYQALAADYESDPETAADAEIDDWLGHSAVE